MKFLFLTCLIFISTHQIKSDLLDHLDHHNDHDDHDDHDDHLDDRLDDLDDHLDDDDRTKSQLQNQLLREIEKFLPDVEPATFVVPSRNDPINIEKSLGFGVPLVPQVHHEPINQPPQTFSAPVQPQFERQSQPLQHQPQQPQPQQEQQPFGIPLEQTFGLIPEQPPQQPQTSFDVVPHEELTVVTQPVAQQLQISIDSGEIIDVDIPGAADPAPLGLSPAHEDYDDIHSNFIGGQGRQLDAGRFSAASFNPFEGDFPRYDIVPRTSFSCGDQILGGYYADTEAECQVFHICLGGGLMGSFLCPNGTLFNQEFFVCDWWFNVDCSLAPQSYQLNARIGADPDSEEELL